MKGSGKPDVYVDAVQRIVQREYAKGLRLSVEGFKDTQILPKIGFVLPDLLFLECRQLFVPSQHRRRVYSLCDAVSNHVRRQRGSATAAPPRPVPAGDPTDSSPATGR